MTDTSSSMRDLRIRVPQEIYAKLEQQSVEEGHATLQAFVGPVVNALGRGEIQRTYNTTGSTVGRKL